MRISFFFFKRLFYRAPLVSLIISALLFSSFYVSFITARSVLSTIEGYKEVSALNAADIFILNLDPESPFEVDESDEDGLDNIYELLGSSFSYGFYTDGYVSQINTNENIEVPISYVNEEYYQLNQFPLSSGMGIEFNYDLDDNPTIPIVVGKGLSDEYPVGTKFSFSDPVLHRDIPVEVRAVLSENFSRSNFYALDSKQYYNFSVVVPVTQKFIQAADWDFKLNGLMDLILTESDANQVVQVKNEIEAQIGLKFNANTQDDNNAFFAEYFRSSLHLMIGINVLLLLVLALTAVWSAISTFKVMIGEFTINLLVGLSYSRLNWLLYRYYGSISVLCLILVIGLTSYSRYQFWATGETYAVTYGLLNLIPMDWKAIFASLVINGLVVTVISQLGVYMIRRIPISIGVLQ